MNLSLDDGLILGSLWAHMGSLDPHGRLSSRLKLQYVVEEGTRLALVVGRNNKQKLALAL